MTGLGISIKSISVK